jgi:hypothetical protein
MLYFLPKKLNNNKVIKLSAEKPSKLSAKKKTGNTRNISTGDIKQIFHDASSGGSFITTEDVIVATIPITEFKKTINPDRLKSRNPATNCKSKLNNEKHHYKTNDQNVNPNHFG